MIDPSKITIYNATDGELEELILFWVCAAGKNGRTAARCLDKFLKLIGEPYGKHMDSISKVYNLPKLLQLCGIGCYNSKAKSFLQLATECISGRLNLRTCTAEDLEKIHGIGMKTSRCFILHSRPDARYAGLDTHVLKHLKINGVGNVPKSTPGTKKEYLRLEKEFLRLADEVGMLPSRYDLMIWNKYSAKSTPGENKKKLQRLIELSKWSEGELISIIDQEAVGIGVIKK